MACGCFPKIKPASALSRYPVLTRPEPTHPSLAFVIPAQLIFTNLHRHGEIRTECTRSPKRGGNVPPPLSERSGFLPPQRRTGTRSSRSAANETFPRRENASWLCWSLWSGFLIHRFIFSPPLCFSVASHCRPPLVRERGKLTRRH